MVRFGDVAQIVTGSTPKAFDENFDGDIPFVTPGDLGEVADIHQAKRSLSALGAASVRTVPKRSVMVCCIGATIGKVGFAARDVATNQQINTLVFDEKIIFPKYAYYYCLTIKSLLVSKSSSTTMPIVNKSNFSDLKMPVPFLGFPSKSLAEQKRIAAILDKADAIRRKRQQAIDLADDFLRSVFLDMFGDPLVNSKKWQVQNLGELTTKITDGKHGDCEDEIGSGYYFISAKDVNHGRINYENTRQINKKEFDEVHRRTDLQAGDLVMVNTGATIGRVAIVMNDEKTSKTTFQKSVAIIKPKGDLLNSNFLKYIFLLRVKDFASVGSGSAIKNLLLSKMREFPIIVPPMELQCKFDRIVSHIESSSIRDAADSELNDELFNSLSQKAFAGEL